MFSIFRKKMIDIEMMLHPVGRMDEGGVETEVQGQEEAGISVMTVLPEVVIVVDGS